MKLEFAVGAIVGAVLIIAILSVYSSTISSPIIPAGYAYSTLPRGGAVRDVSGSFVVQPREFGGEIRQAAGRGGFVGKAVELDRNNCYECRYDGKVIGYSAEEESAAKRACRELGGTLTYVHEGSCSSSEAAAK